jgi:hypothetical protein
MAGRDAWILSDEQWELVHPLLPRHERSAHGGRSLPTLNVRWQLRPWYVVQTYGNLYD